MQAVEVPAKEVSFAPVARGTFSVTGWSPPSKSLTFDEWAEVLEGVRTAERSVMWWIGDLLAYGEKRYGKTYEDALEATDYSYQTLRDAKWACERIELSRRLDNLSFSHHREVAPLPPHEQDELLGQADSEGWSKNTLRKAVRERKIERATIGELQEPRPLPRNLHADACPLCGADSPDGILVSIDLNVALVDKEIVELGPVQSVVLWLLAEHIGEEVGTSILYQRAFGIMQPEGFRMDNIIFELRQKLSETAWTITTIRGRGYRLEKAESET